MSPMHSPRHETDAANNFTFNKHAYVMSPKHAAGAVNNIYFNKQKKTVRNSSIEVSQHFLALPRTLE